MRILLVVFLLCVAGIQTSAEQRSSGSVELINTLSGHTQNVIAIEFSHDGARLATSSEDGTVRLWGVANGECLATIPGQEKQWPWKISWSADDGKLAITYVGNKSWDVVVWDTPATAPPTIEHHFQNIPSLKFNPWEVMTGEPRIPRWITDESSVVSFSPSGKTVITVKNNPEGKLWHPHSYLTLRKIANGEELLTVEIPEGGLQKIFWSPDEKTIAVMGSTFDTRLFDAVSGRENGRLPLGQCWPGTWIGSDGCEAFRFSADSAVMLKDMKPLKLWDVRRVSVISELPRARPPALFSPTDARLLATRSEDKKSVSLWRLKWPNPSR